MVIHRATMKVIAGMQTRDIQRPAIERTSLLAAHVGWRREGLRKTLVRPKGEEDLGTPRLPLVHDTRVLEFLDESFLAPI